MTKDQFLVSLVSSWWGCIRDNEVEEYLNGADGLTPEEVRKHYPDWNEDEEGDVVEQAMKDVRAFLKRLKNEPQ